MNQMAPLPPPRSKTTWEPISLEECARWIESYNRYAEVWRRDEAERNSQAIDELKGRRQPRPADPRPRWEEAEIIMGFLVSALMFRTLDGRMVVMRFRRFRAYWRDHASIENLIWAGYKNPKQRRRRH